MSDPAAFPLGFPRGFQVLLAVVIAVAFTGYFVGTNEEIKPVHPPTAAQHGAVAAGQVPPAVSYLEMDARQRGPNANWVNSFSKLATTRPGIFDSVATDDAAKQLALAARTSRRAFDGAPPVIPHPITQQSAASCLVCHEQGTRIGEKTAPRLSHASYTNCTQCHVESQNPAIAGEPLAANDFVGKVPPVSGTRAWQGAPPTIPHSTWMRSECTSCHGLLGQSGMRSTHPWRQNCMQCHAPAADQEQMPAQLLAQEREPGPKP